MEITVHGELFHCYQKSQTDKKGVTRTYLRASVTVSSNPVKRIEVTAPDEERLRHKIIDLQLARRLEDESKSTFRQYIESWLQTNKVRLKTSTFEGYRYSFNHYVYPRIGEKRMCDLTEHDMAELLSSIINIHGLSVASHVRILLGRPLAEAAEKRLTYGNIVRNVRLQKLQTKIMIPLSPGECRSMLKLCLEDRIYGGPIAISLLTGLRISECIGLSNQDVDIDRKIIHVRRQITRVSGKSILQNSTKNNKERIIYMDDVTLHFVKREKELQAEKKIKAGIKWSNEYDCFFTDNKGSFLRHASLRKHFHSMTEKINRPGIRFHLLRHTAATILHEETNNIQSVKDFLGHKRYDSTGVYIHSSEEMLKRTSEAISDYIAKA